MFEGQQIDNDGTECQNPLLRMDRVEVFSLLAEMRFPQMVTFAGVGLDAGEITTP